MARLKLVMNALYKIRVPPTKISHNYRGYLYCPVSLIFVNCATQDKDKFKKIEYLDSSQLSLESLIHQACTASVNSTSQLLTTTLVGLVDVAQQYRKALEDQLTVVEACLTNIGNEGVQQELSDLTIATRSKIAMYKKHFMEMVSLMEYVEKLVNAVTDASFIAGAETACNALSERMHSAKLVVDEHINTIKKLEEELLELQRLVIVKTQDKSENNGNS